VSPEDGEDPPEGQLGRASHAAGGGVAQQSLVGHPRVAVAAELLVEAAGLFGGRQALKLTAFVPATMFVCYAVLLAWFAMRGGYRARGLGH
jgi:hypothetical protein